MRCEACCGTGFSALGNDPMICLECRGSGLVYCCDEAGANPPNVYPPEIEKRLEDVKEALGLRKPPWH
jgi:hypothetical protein